MSIAENIATASDFKQKGNDAFRKNDLKEALKNYTKIFLYVNHLDQGTMSGIMDGVAKATGPTKQQSASVTELKLTGNTNCAQCFFKQGNLDKAKEFVERALAVDAASPKAIFLRGRIRLRTGELEGAREDLEASLKRNPDDKLIKSELELLKKRDAEAEKKSRKTFGGFLNKSKISLADPSDPEPVPEPEPDPEPAPEPEKKEEKTEEGKSEDGKTEGEGGEKKKKKGIQGILSRVITMGPNGPVEQRFGPALNEPPLFGPNGKLAQDAKKKKQEDAKKSAARKKAKEEADKKAKEDAAKEPEEEEGKKRGASGVEELPDEPEKEAPKEEAKPVEKKVEKEKAKDEVQPAKNEKKSEKPVEKAEQSVEKNKSKESNAEKSEASKSPTSPTPASGKKKVGKKKSKAKSP